MMDLLDWLDLRRPGQKELHGDELRIIHPNGSVSSLWQRATDEPVPVFLRTLSDVYGRFDGADLFSSTFKIAGLTSKGRGGVEIVPSIDALEAEAEREGVVFPEPCLLFMLQAGIGLYGVSTVTGLIYEWDSEAEEISGQYKRVSDILDEWLSAVS